MNLLRWRRLSVCLCLWLLTGLAQAFVPTPKDDCLHRNEAICRINGMEVHQAQPCPPHAQTIRPLGTEDCSRFDAPRTQRGVWRQ